MATMDWTAYCTEMVPELLTNWGAGDIAEEVGADIQRRSESFALSGRNARGALQAPFLEEVVGYDPQQAPQWVRAAVCVVVRCSLLEEAHRRVVDDGGIAGLTGVAAAPLTLFLHEHANRDLGPPAGVFEALGTRWPRAWAALDALAAVADGGRAGFRMPSGPKPELPADNELVDGARGSDGQAMILSGIDAGFDPDAMAMLREAGPDFTAVISSLSRLSRDVDKQMRMLEILLSRGSTVLTTNYMIRPGEASVRKGQLEAFDSAQPSKALRIERGLSGVHRKVLRTTLDSLDEPSLTRAT